MDGVHPHVRTCAYPVDGVYVYGAPWVSGDGGSTGDLIEMTDWMCFVHDNYRITY